MLHYYVSTSLGLIQSNMSWMYVHKGPAYQWLLDVFDKMSLPRFDGMAEALNVSRFKSLLKVKQCDVKCKGRRARKRHKQSEQAVHKLWVEQHKTCHTYGKETPKLFCKRKAKRDETRLSVTDFDQDLGSECCALATEIAHSGITDDNVIDQGISNIILNNSDDRKAYFLVLMRMIVAFRIALV